MTFEQAIAIIVVAVITAAGSIYAARKSAKNDQNRINQAMVTVLGVEREKIAAELDRATIRTNATNEQLEKVGADLRAAREELTEVRITHREAIAEKDATIRERDATIREVQARTIELEAMLNACRTELGQVRAELQNALTLIHDQARALQAQRNGDTGG
jgi:DNA repair exonuclease SbcCD ATPase subunit